MDLYRFSSNGISIALSNGSGFESYGTVLNDFTANEGITSSNTTPRIVADVDGDGRDDIICF
jgi:hypothetical protein